MNIMKRPRIKGTLPTCRSVTWLVYLNDNWLDSEGGVLRCFPRSDVKMNENSYSVGVMRVIYK